jgi:hypothetical protein
MIHSSSSYKIELPGFLKPNVDVKAAIVVIMVIVVTAVMVSMTVSIVIIAVMVETTVEAYIAVLTSVVSAVLTVMAAMAITTAAMTLAGTIMPRLSAPVLSIIVSGVRRSSLGVGPFNGPILRHTQACSKQEEKQQQKDFLTHGFSPPYNGNRTGDYLPFLGRHHYWKSSILR